MLISKRSCSVLLLILVWRLVLIIFNDENSCSTRLVEMGRLNKSSQSMRMLGHLLESGLAGVKFVPDL